MEGQNSLFVAATHHRYASAQKPPLPERELARGGRVSRSAGTHPTFTEEQIQRPWPVDKYSRRTTQAALALCLREKAEATLRGIASHHVHPLHARRAESFARWMDATPNAVLITDALHLQRCRPRRAHLWLPPGRRPRLHLSEILPTSRL